MANPRHYASPNHEMSPAVRHYQIVPSDTDKLPDQPKAIYCAAGTSGVGLIVIEDEAGVSLTYSIPVGTFIPFRATKVRATGTAGTFFGWL